MLKLTYELAHVINTLEKTPYILIYTSEDKVSILKTNLIEDDEGIPFEELYHSLETLAVNCKTHIQKSNWLCNLTLYYVTQSKGQIYGSYQDEYCSVWIYNTETQEVFLSMPKAFFSEAYQEVEASQICGKRNENRIISEIIQSREPLSYPSFLTETWCNFCGKPVLMMLSEFKSSYKQLRFGIGEVVRKDNESHSYTNEPHFMDLNTQLPNTFYFMSSFRYKQKENHLSALAFFYIQQWERTLNAFGIRYVQMLFKTLEQYLKSITDDEVILFLYNQSTLGVYVDMEDETQLKQFCEQVIEYFKTPWYYDDFVFFSNVKIGVSCFPDHSRNPLELINYSNMALKNLSRTANSDYLIFNYKMKNEISENIFLFGEIRSAMDNREFEMFYQPQVSLSSGRIVGAEALVRWRHPQRGLVSPALFLPAISKIGLDYLLDQYVVNAVSQDQAKLKEMGIGNLPISFNLSASSLNTENIYDDINDTIMMNDADSSMMVIEITETAEVFMNPHLNERLRSLKGIGLNISIDDFGTGYSSLSYLASLPVDAVKIDKSFSDGYPDDQGRLFLIDKIVEIASCFHLDLTLEGIETQSQVQYFKENLSKQVVEKIKIQGYYYYKPMAFEDFVKHLKTS